MNTRDVGRVHLLFSRGAEQFNHAASRSIIPQHAVQSRRKQFNRSAACGSIIPQAVQSFRSVRFNHPSTGTISFAEESR
jgi:hypothetical protein